MAVQLFQKQVGPWPMNAYLILCDQSRAAALVDPGADAELLLAWVEENEARLEKILITHGHGDHIQALDEIKVATGAPVYMHPADAKRFDLQYDISLQDSDLIQLGECSLQVIPTPGHTVGITCFDLGDGRVIVGDTIFVGGPGKTWSSEEFAQTMRTLQEIVFAWPDDTQFYPGHGPTGKIGDERMAFEAFVSKGWPDDLFGDVTWE